MSGGFTMRACLTKALGLALFLSVCVGVIPAFAQGTAGIIGQVKDESNAVIPGVTVSASSEALQVAQVSTVTDANGEYRLAQLPLGVYTVKYELQGFGSITRDDIRLP